MEEANRNVKIMVLTAFLIALFLIRINGFLRLLNVLKVVYELKIASEIISTIVPTPFTMLCFGNVLNITVTGPKS